MATLMFAVTSAKLTDAPQRTKVGVRREPVRRRQEHRVLRLDAKTVARDDRHEAPLPERSCFELVANPVVVIEDRI